MTSPPPPGRLRSFAFLALAMATVGSIVPASRVIGGAVPPFLAGALRLALAAAVLVPWAARREWPALAAPLDRHDALLLALQAAGGTVGFTVLLLLGTARTSAADASVVAGSLPAVAAVLSALLFRERPGRRGVTAVGLALAGVLAVSATDAGGARAGAPAGAFPGRTAGNLLVLGAVACEALFILLNKRLRRRLPALSQSAVMTALGLLALAPAAVVEAAAMDLGAVPARAWLAVAYYGLVPTVLGFVWWYRGTEGASGTEAAVFTAVMPIAGAGLSWAVLGEPLAPRHAVGLGLVVAAIVVAALPRRVRAGPIPESS